MFRNGCMVGSNQLEQSNVVAFGWTSWENAVLRSNRKTLEYHAKAFNQNGINYLTEWLNFLFR